MNTRRLLTSIGILAGRRSARRIRHGGRASHSHRDSEVCKRPSAVEAAGGVVIGEPGEVEDPHHPSNPRSKKHRGDSDLPSRGVAFRRRQSKHEGILRSRNDASPPTANRDWPDADCSDPRHRRLPHDHGYPDHLRSSTTTRDAGDRLWRCVRDQGSGEVGEGGYPRSCRARDCRCRHERRRVHPPEKLIDQLSFHLPHPFYEGGGVEVGDDYRRRLRIERDWWASEDPQSASGDTSSSSRSPSARG